MSRLLAIFLLAVLLTGCKTYTQVFNTNSVIELNEEGQYMYEDDSVRITYNFWNEKGLMKFSIFNKLEKPLYVDWKKSSYIDNSVKLNYWVDELQSSSRTEYARYFYNVPVSVTSGISQTSTIKVERITFIPPKSSFSKSQYYIYPHSHFRFDKNTRFRMVSRDDNSKKETKLYFVEFPRDKSPIVFRNFLTFSLQEDFDNEFYIDNEFYVSEIMEMDKRHFGQYRYDDTGRHLIINEEGIAILFSNFKQSSSFFISIPKDANIEKMGASRTISDDMYPINQATK